MLVSEVNCMKKKILFLLLALVLIIPVLTQPIKREVYAYENMGEISVIGESTISLTPDMAKVSATITQVDMDLESAKNKVFEIYSNVKNSLQNSEHISKINLVYFTTYPTFDYSQGKTLTGYNSTLSFDYEVDQIDQIQISIDSLINCGVKNINSVNYQVKDYASQYNELLQSAIDNAVGKAKILLQKDDVIIKNIVEQETYNACYLCKSYFAENVSNDFDSKIEISAKVKVVFE